MKKSVIIILAILPIFLLVIISFAGKIVAAINHVPVERVAFVSDKGDEYDSGAVIKIGKGKTQEMQIIIYPELASNKKVEFTSADPSVFTVDANGVITGVDYGSSTLSVKTRENNKTAIINIVVTDDAVTGVEIAGDDIQLIEGQTKDLEHTVYPFTSLNKNVTWQSSNPAVATVNAQGIVRAISEGEAVITVTTVDGGFTDTITVTVSSGALPIEFDFSSLESITVQNGVYVSSEAVIAIKDYIKVDTELGLDAANAVYSIKFGSSHSSLDNGVLTITKPSQLITLTVSCGGYSCELRFWFNPSTSDS